MEVSSVYNWLPQEEWLYIVQRTLGGASWQFSGHSNGNNAIRFWYMDLNDDTFFTRRIFNRIVEQTQTSWRLITVYANGQTHGLPGDLHQDEVGVEPKKFYTVLYYANPDWQPTWGGSTVFTNSDTGEIMLRHPTPNSMSIFDSTIWHAGLEPTRHCTDLRVTVAFKLERV